MSAFFFSRYRAWFLRYFPALLGILAALFMVFAGCRDKSPRKPSAGAAVSAPVIPVHAEKTQETVELSGTVRAVAISVLSSKIPGRITAISVREGDRVRRGEVLARIDDREANAGVAQAEAAVRQARFSLEETEKALGMAQAELRAAEARSRVAAATYRRFQALVERESVSRQEFDEVKARWESASADADRARLSIQALRAKREQALAALHAAESSLEAARALRAYADVTAPMDALVTAKHAEVGQMATPGLPILTVEDPSDYRLEVSVPEAVLTEVRLGDTVPVRIEGTLAEIGGRVVEILPSLDAATRTGLVKIGLPSSETHEAGAVRWRSGAFGRARFATGFRNTLRVPAEAVARRGQLTGLFVVDENQVCRWRLVRTGQTAGDRVEILSGLRDGERIVARIVPELSDGTPITAE
ncbi:MAG: efflux RND transporter periplasmic adaptor subunit [Desulfosoma sp.]